MATLTLTKDNFDRTVTDNDMVVVDFWAPWCAPCRAFAPVFESAAERNPDIVFAKVNTDEQPDLAGMFGIRSIPTLMIMRERVVLYHEPGALPASALDDVLQKAQSLDMAQVHEELAQEQGHTQPQGEAATGEAASQPPSGDLSAERRDAPARAEENQPERR
jgi:thioredoxin 1